MSRTQVTVVSGVLMQVLLAVSVARAQDARTGVDERFTEQAIERLREATTSSADSGFAMFYRYRHQIDQVMRNAFSPWDPVRGGRPTRPSYSDAVLDRIIFKEEIYELAMKPLGQAMGGAADLRWEALHAAIQRKYGQPYADRVISETKVKWYGRQTDWYKKNNNQTLREQNATLFCRSVTELLKSFAPDLGEDINGYAWPAFERCRDREQLTVAAHAMAALVWWQAHPQLKVPDWVRANNIDTYANLLYKSGQTDAAIRWEERAVNMVKSNPEAANLVEEFGERLAKMRKGLPTWPQD